ncbi:MAG: membrane protein insertase YidC [Arenicella sp.]
MDNQRVFILAAIAFTSFFLFSEWQRFTAQKNAPAIEQALTDSGVPAAPDGSLGSATDQSVPSVSSSAVDISVPQTAPAIDSGAERITVETDLLVAVINTEGGGIESLRLKKELETLDNPDLGFQLLKSSPEEIFVTQTGLIGQAGEYPNHYSKYTAAADSYVLSNNQQQISVPLNWVSPSGQSYTKTLTFKRDSYIVDISFEHTNLQNSKWDGFLYAQFKRSEPLNEKKGSFIQLPSFRGGIIYTPENKYEKVSFSDIEDDNLDVKTTQGWVGMLQHYFVGAWLPENKQSYNFYSSHKPTANPEYTIGYKTLNPVLLSPNETGKLTTSVFLGPKEQSRLKEIQNNRGVDGLALTVDYGWLTVIADPLFWVLDKIHDVVKNWGWSIIILTILIKLAFYPLSAASYRSMARMKKLQPRMTTLKERYGDDRAQFQQEMMKLYKEEKVNPAGGCLPILVQIPVFIALYYVLLESVELRLAPFALWWQDLSAPDPYYVLPILMGLSMFLQQKLNPAPMEQMQKNIMMIMPLVLTFLFLTFPQGLVLYWVVNNCLSILQQWRINSTIGADK